MWLWAVETTALSLPLVFLVHPVARPADGGVALHRPHVGDDAVELVLAQREQVAHRQQRAALAPLPHGDVEHEPAQERLGLVGPELVAAVVAVHDEHLGDERRVVGRVERPLADEVERVEGAVPDGAPTDRAEQAGVSEPERIERDDVVAKHAGPVARGQREVLALGVGDQDRAGVVEQVRHDGPDALAGARRRDGEHVARPVVAQERTGPPLSVPLRPIDGVAGLGGVPPLLPRTSPRWASTRDRPAPHAAVPCADDGGVGRGAVATIRSASARSPPTAPAPTASVASGASSPTARTTWEVQSSPSAGV